MNAMEALRRNVVRKRAESHLSQATLAGRANVSRATVSKIEQGNGNVTVANLEKVALVLGCTVDQLFEPRAIPCDAAELLRRANSPRSEFIDAEALLNAIDEANEGRTAVSADTEIRYSKAGRPAMARGTASRGR